MLSTLALFVTAFLALFATAAPAPFPGATAPVSQCNSGPVQCCQSTYQSNSPAGAFLLGAVGVPVQSVVTTVGFQCNPISSGTALGGAAGTAAKCSSQPVCCNQGYLQGLVNNACIPLNSQVM